jgi:hypothetical protein
MIHADGPGGTGLITVVIRRSRKLAPSVRPTRGILSVTGIFRQLRRSASVGLRVILLDVLRLTDKVQLR